MSGWAGGGGRVSEGGNEGGREGGKEERRKGGREGGREGGKKGASEQGATVGGWLLLDYYITYLSPPMFLLISKHMTEQTNQRMPGSLHELEHWERGGEGMNEQMYVHTTRQTNQGTKECTKLEGGVAGIW